MTHSVKKLIIRLVSKRRSFRVSILTLFLSLFTLAFVAVLTFTYEKNYKSILTFSRTVANETIATIRSQFKSMALSSQQIVRTSVEFFPSLGPLDSRNPILVAYLLNMVKNDPNFSNIYIGLPNGNMVSALKLSVSSHRFFVKNRFKKLPDNVQFVLYHCNANASPPIETFSYLD
jgi:hypothetical protein